MRPALALASLLAGAIGAVAGCVVELAPRVSCGDNFIDVLAGEECEPGVPDSWADACDGVVPGPSVCDPVTCKISADRCSPCGNGVVDDGEECDGDDLAGQSCIDGELTCDGECRFDRSGCPLCGNGQLDLDEECDPGVVGDLAGPISCTELESPAGVSQLYGSGTSFKCRSDCRWDRSGCSFCSNDVVDPQSPVDDDTVLKAEVCDGDSVATESVDAFEAYCKSVCETNYRVWCNFDCVDCKTFASPPPPQPLDCCTPQGVDCPYEQPGNTLKDGRRPCCSALLDPGDPEPCELFSDNGKQSLLCK